MSGLVLRGTEIKSIRAGKVNLTDAFARIERGEAWLIGAHIAPWEGGNRYNHEPKRDRKLLLHRREVHRLGPVRADQGEGLLLRLQDGGHPLAVNAVGHHEGLAIGRHQRAEHGLDGGRPGARQQDGGVLGGGVRVDAGQAQTDVRLQGCELRLAVAQVWAEQRLAGFSASGFKGQLGVGALLGMAWSPCVGPTLGAASLLASQAKDLPQVAATMLLFGLGAASPLLVIGMSRLLLLGRKASQ